LENVKQKCENFALLAAPGQWNFPWLGQQQRGNLLAELALIPLENSRFVYLKGAHNSANKCRALDS